MVLRHLLLLTFPFLLLSEPIDFKACQLKYQVSSLAIGDTQAVVIDDRYGLFYSKEEPIIPVLKRDPFLGLNLIELPKSYKHKFKFYTVSPTKIAAITPTSIDEGRIITQQNGLNSLGNFSTQLKQNSLIVGSCCGIVALTTDDAFIEKEYIRYFLKSEAISYSELGVRFKNDDGVRVAEKNPFFQGSPFMYNDRILTMDGIAVKSAEGLSKRILFSPVNSLHRFTLLRNGKKHKAEVITQQRVSGGLIPESFFETSGLILDEKLIVRQDTRHSGVKTGDRLILVMGERVNSLVEVKEVLSRKDNGSEGKIALLFRRNGFDFFIHLNRP